MDIEQPKVHTHTNVDTRMSSEANTSAPVLATCVTITNGKSRPIGVSDTITTTTSTRASSRKNRVYVFREFLLQTYGREYLSRSGGGLLDVAGGKGDLSWLVTNADGIRAVIADPRVPNHSHLIRSIKFLVQNPQEAKTRAIPDQPTHQPLASLLPNLVVMQGNALSFQSPHHLRLFVDSDLVDAVRVVTEEHTEEAAASNWEKYWKTATERARLGTTLGYQEHGHSSHQILDASEALRTICSLKVIVGFHPDQATEACIDLAVLLGIPFCVCPCCVFPSEFPNRTIRGQPVRTHAEFVQYLCEKYPHIRTASLDFHETKTAKNKVLYVLDEDLRH